jgi:hypothetical protein
MLNIEKIFKEADDLKSRLVEKGNIDEVLRKLRETKIDFCLEDGNPFATVCEKPGIYFIEARFQFTTEEELKRFGEAWGYAKGISPVSNCPRFYKGRVKPNLSALRNSEYVPFYLGKQQNVKARLNLHLNDSLESTTYGLKLRARREILKKCNLRASWVTFNSTASNYFCVELIESALREKLNPIIGKQ